MGRRSEVLRGVVWGGERGERGKRGRKFGGVLTPGNPDRNHRLSLKGDVLNATSRLKERLRGEILVYGSIQLARSLIEHNLADELRLMVYPVVLGAGERLFGETSENKPLRLVEARTVGDDLACLIHEPGEAPGTPDLPAGPPFHSSSPLVEMSSLTLRSIEAAGAASSPREGPSPPHFRA